MPRTPAAVRPIEPDVLLAEADGLAELGGDDDVALAVGQPGPHELGLRPEADGDDAALADVLEFAQGGLLDLAVRRQHDDELVLAEVLDGDDRGDLLAGLELDQVDDGLAPAGDADVGDLQGLQPVDPARCW